MLLQVHIPLEHAPLDCSEVLLHLYHSDRETHWKETMRALFEIHLFGFKSGSVLIIIFLGVNYLCSRNHNYEFVSGS